MRIKLFPTLMIALAALPSLAQKVDYNKIILPRDASNISIAERLVQIAWDNNPAHRVLDYELQTAELRKKKVGLVWLENIGVNGNLNEFNIKSFNRGSNSTQEGNQFFPRYNVYARLPLSIFFEVPQNKKIAIHEIQIAKEKQNLGKLEIRARVLNAYEEYLRTQQLLDIARRFELAQADHFVVVEEQFRAGKITPEQYLSASKEKFDRQIQRVNAETNFNVAKIALEEILGVSVTDAGLEP